MRTQAAQLLLCVVVYACLSIANASFYRGKSWRLLCAAPTKGDPVIDYTELYGRPNLTDSAWHDDTWAFMAYGPITALDMFHSGKGWNDPYIGFHEGGEFKGLQPTYGNMSNDMDLLFGAKKPHHPSGFQLQPGEMIVRVEVQWDRVLRWMAFTTQLGRRFEWGFKDEPDASSATAWAPREGAYLAAFRGFEGKPLPPELGGYKKRYIIQVGFVWAMPRCYSYQWNPDATERGRIAKASLMDKNGKPTKRARLLVPPAPPFAPIRRLPIAPAPPLPTAQPPAAVAPAATAVEPRPGAVGQVVHAVDQVSGRGFGQGH